MTVSCWECVRGHIMPVCCHTVFIEAEYAAGGNFGWRKRTVSFSLRPVFVSGWWLNCRSLWSSEHRRLSEEGRWKPFLCTDPITKWTSQVAICRDYKEKENRTMRSWTAFPRFGCWAAGVLKRSQKPWNHSPYSSSKHTLTWLCFYDNYQRKLKEQSAQKGFGDSLTSISYLSASKYF